MPQYAEDAAFQQHTKDLLEVRFGDGHADELNSSSTSLHLDEGDPSIRKKRDGIYVYHGDAKKQRITEIGDIATDDRALTPQGHVALSNAVKKTYKAFSKAIDDNLFRLEGEYDCVNRYIRSGMTENDFLALPEIRADRLIPYYYKRSSLIRGVVNYSKDLPLGPANSGYQRRVIVVNVDTNGTLHNSIPDRTVVYLGGNHDGQDIAFSSRTRNVDEEERKRSTKFVTYRYCRQYDPAGDESCYSFIASPVPKTWTFRKFGLNVGVAKLRNGHFLYWATNCQPVPGQQLSKLSLEHIPRAPFKLPEKVRSWPVYDKGARLEDIFEGAWVLRGDRLILRVNDEDYPAGLLARLRVGFFRVQRKEMFVNISRIEARIVKAISSFARYGGKMFGFDEKPAGIIECDIERLASHLKFETEVLLAFIGRFASSFKYFQGTISFLLDEKPEGKFKITGPVPVGSWMHGIVTDTGSGLVYVGLSEKYFSMENIDGVSWLSEVTEASSTEQPYTKLGQWIAFAN